MPILFAVLNPLLVTLLRYKETVSFREEAPRSAPKLDSAEHQNNVHVGVCGGFLSTGRKIYGLGKRQSPLRTYNRGTKTHKIHSFKPHFQSAQFPCDQTFAYNRNHPISTLGSKTR
jgi:hypothetical protein